MSSSLACERENAMKNDKRLIMVLISLMGFFYGIVGWAQPADKGVIVLKDESIEEISNSNTLGSLILEPVQLTALLGYSVDGTLWTELGATAGFWLSDFHVSGEAELRGLTFNVGLEAETQLSNLGLTAGIRLFNSGMQLSGGVRTTWENFTIAARAIFGSNALSANASVVTQLGELGVHMGASLSGNQFTASTGATLPLPGDLLTLSASAGFDKTGFSVSAGADALVSSTLGFSANASLGESGMTASLGGQFAIESFDLSAHGTWSEAGLGITADGQFQFDAIKLFGRVRFDEDSFSADVGAATRWNIFVPTLTIGLDQLGFKWIQLEVMSEFDPASWLAR
jgi:hypothetical protein